MILLNNADTLSASNKAEKSLISSEGNNRDLWKQAMEKNGLYQVLDAFKVVKYSHNLVESLETQSLEVFDKTPKIEKVYEFTQTQTNNEPFAKVAESESQSFTDLKIKNEINIIPLRLLNSVFLNQNFLSRLIEVTKHIQAANTTQDISYNVQWNKKNVVTTLVDSNLELWIRDASLTETKLSKILENIKRTMGELGASLSKVTVNGKITFKAKQ